WNTLRCDDLPAGVDLVVFDFAVDLGIEVGPTVAAKTLQKAVGAGADGSVGSATIAAAKAKSSLDTVHEISKAKIDYYSKQPAQPASVADRTKRTTAVEQAAVNMINKAEAPTN